MFKTKVKFCFFLRPFSLWVRLFVQLSEKKNKRNQNMFYDRRRINSEKKLKKTKYFWK
jgi:hypothetical protein